MTHSVSRRGKYLFLCLLLLAAVLLYMTVGVRFDKPMLLAYAMRLRSTKVAVMLLVAFAIGSASIVFQSIIRNTIVTPCLLGINSLYSLVHILVAFFWAPAVFFCETAMFLFC